MIKRKVDWNSTGPRIGCLPSTILDNGAPLRILVVEDEPDLRSAICQALREDGYAVDEAEEGQLGLSKAQLRDYDAMVLDLMLPKLSGLELLRELRRAKQTPVLILTAKDAVEDRVVGLDTGADDYLVKPFQLAELLARMRALIRRSAGQVDPIVEIKGLSIDTNAREVFQSGARIELTAREYRLLELLIVHRNKLVTRTMIYDHLFDEMHDSMSNMIDVYVSRLRSKLGKDFVSTRRGEGYIVYD
ncbi:MAG: response regulator transcription factor [Planctomycetota bacterium]